MASIIPALKKAWKDVFGTNPPDDEQWAVWQRLHTQDVLRDGLLATCLKFKRLGGIMDDTYKIRYMSKACNTLSFERNAALQALQALEVTPSHTAWDIDSPLLQDDDNRGNR